MRHLFPKWHQTLVFDLQPREISQSMATCKVWAAPNNSSLQDLQPGTCLQIPYAREAGPLSLIRNESPPARISTPGTSWVFRLGCQGWGARCEVSSRLGDQDLRWWVFLSPSLFSLSKRNLNPICLPVLLYSSLKGTFSRSRKAARATS